MRILVDGQTLGTPELRRGIGKVFLEILHEMINGDVSHDWFISLRDQAHFDHITPLLRRFIKPLVLTPIAASGEPIEWCRTYGRQLQEVALSIRADVCWNPNPLMPNVHYPLGFTQCPVVVTLHDLIPRVMPEHFRPALGEGNWRDYLERCTEMAESNSWIVGVSKYSAQDFLKFQPDCKAHVRYVHLASNYSRFWPYRQGDRLSDPPYVLYVGGFDPRKNMDNALRAFAAFAAKPGLEDVRFKVICANDTASRDRYFALSRALSVAERLDLPGYVTDDELGFLFRGASVFFFPSLYEGFGLPVLDALACGIPVVASKTSAIPEVAGDHAIYCDPTDVTDMAQALDRAWLQRDPNSPRRIAAVEYARSFRWAEAAKQYLCILDEAGTASRSAQVSRLSRRPRIAYLSPWPPQTSGVADYCYRLMPELLARMDITLFAENPQDCVPMAGLEIHSLDDYPVYAAGFDNTIYHLGNGLSHVKIYEHAWRIPGVIVLHDFNIHPFFQHGFLGHPREALYESALLDYGDEGQAAWSHYQITGSRPDVWQFPMSHPIARRSRATVVHSRWVADRLIGIDNVLRVHHGAQPKTGVSAAEQQQLRRNLSLDEDAYWIGVFGFINWHKRLESVLVAAKVLISQNFPLRLLIVGAVNDKKLDILAMAQRIGVADIVRHEGYVPESRFLEYVKAVDVVCNLRYPTMGESSGSMFHCLALGKATLVSDYGSFSEIPDRVAWKIDPKVDEIEHLSLALELLMKHPAARKAFGANGRNFVSSKASLELVAQCYCRTIENSMIVKVSGDQKPDSGDDASPCSASEATGAVPTEAASQAHRFERSTNLKSEESLGIKGVYDQTHLR